MTAGEAASRPPAGDETVGFGHAKVILLGEHAVVFGHPAIAAGLPLGVRARVRPGRGRARAPGWQLDVALDEALDAASPVGHALGRLIARLGADPAALDVELETEIPARGGLGSSAAMAVAVARAVGARTGAGPADQEAAVATSEEVFHGRPSGVDAAAARHGGIGVFTKGEGWQPTAVRQPVKLCLGLSGQPRLTGDLVEAVGHLCRRQPSARRMIDELGELSRAGLEALAVGDIDGLGRLFDLAHGILGGLRLSTLSLERLVHGARESGAIGAKLTGAGGGGAVIALAPSHRTDVLRRWSDDGFQSLEARIEGGLEAGSIGKAAMP
jgi:hydroxymethylglutaryl-CoA reductase